MEAVWGLVEGCMGIDMGANAHHMRDSGGLLRGLVEAMWGPVCAVWGRVNAV